VSLRAVLLGVTAASLACAAVRPVPPEVAGSARAEVRALSREYLAAWFRFRPEEGTTFGFPGTDPAAVQDVTPAALRAWEAAEDGFLARLRAGQAPHELIALLVSTEKEVRLLLHERQE
jgi:hypothetical protein